MQSWIGERMVEEHRRDLTASTRTGIGGEAERDDLALMAEAVTAPRDQVVPRETPKTGAARRPLAPSVGALLIRVGTRLGGTTMRTS